MLTVAAASAKVSGLAQLRRVAAALWSTGAEVDLSVLDEPVVAEPVVAEPVVAEPVVAEPVAAEPVAEEPVAAPAVPVVPAALLAEYQALLDETAEAARVVLAAAASPVRRRVRRAASAHAAPTSPPPAAAVPTPAPTPETTPAPVPAAAATATETTGATGGNGGTPGTPGIPGTPGAPPSRHRSLRLSVEEQPWWLDHAFFQQPDGWPDTEDTFPLVPMTGIVQLLVEEAEALVPGAVTVRVESVRAFKWLAVDPPVEVTVRAAVDPVATEQAPEGTTVVRTSVDGHARAVVHLAARHPEPPAPWNRFIRGRLEMPCPVEEVYTRRHLFHGPAYQGIRSIEVFGGDGVRGTLESQTATGALLDNAGQLFGYWFACAVDRDRMVLPTTMDSITYHGPHPAPGTLVDCVAHCTELTDDAVRADLELLVDGVLWCRIEGWEDRRFQSDDRLFRVLKQPQPHLLAQPQPGGWMLVREGWPDSPSRDIVMRRFLGVAERADYAGRNPRAQRTWLLGRIAAKDAVRREVLERGLEPLFPVEVQLRNEESGRPVVTTSTGLDLQVSIAHSGSLGVALASVGTPVGIDIELVAERSAIFEAASLSADEHELFVRTSGGDRDRELTRWWAAKEAAAKALGTGLQGRPKGFEVLEVDFHHLRVGDQWVATRSLVHPEPPAVGGVGGPDDPASGQDPDQTPAVAAPASAAREEYIVAWTVPDPRHG
ncbi:4'-phosphopantetheinyl transferase superfamily protein [Nocardioides solisilvae]|uniref:4'-phosphopantetheinyl transferase superfamily protein n=1 Tax=Nocardioides solisilvae TaxID=1542435 RepID=UPI000D74F6EA|nr:4'-phosphopantetheinyl transferase superfamily protein [Nocardioides solisilvae]